MKCVSCDDESITPPQQQSGEASVSEGRMSGCSASCWSYLFLVYIISLVLLLLIRVLLLWVGPEHEEPELHTHWKLNDAPQSNIFSILLHLHNIMMLKPQLVRILPSLGSRFLPHAYIQTGMVSNCWFHSGSGFWICSAPT